MNAAIENLNQWAGQFSGLAEAMFWQSSLLALVILALDFALRRHLRASVRYTLWLVFLVKLITPPSLALPTSPAWWWHSAAPVVLPAPPVQYSNYIVTHEDALAPEATAPILPEPTPPPPALTRAAIGLLASAGVSLTLLGWLAWRWMCVMRLGRTVNEDPAWGSLLEEPRRMANIRVRVRVKITEDTMSPAVCGLFRPVVLLPRSLSERLSPEQLRAVLLHELMHVRRGDGWVNYAQALLQIIYWWHPLIWLANARIRRLREEAVDDAVIVALREDADIYAPTLLAVAKFALDRPLTSLGLVGILESRSALRQRIERLVNFPAPRKAGLGLVSAFGILIFSAVALPMGEAPAPLIAATSLSPGIAANAPAVNVAEASRLSLKIFKLTPDSGLINFRGQTGLNAKNTEAEYVAAFFRMLAKEGTPPPANSLWLGDQGLLLAQGTPAELNAVERLFLRLNGFPLISTPPLVNNSVNTSSPAQNSAGAEVTATNLFLRTFKLNTKTVLATLQKATDRSTPFGIKEITGGVRGLCGRFGVKFIPPKAMFYNDGRGLLFVKATSADLDTIERLVEAINQTPATTTSANDQRVVNAMGLYEKGQLADAEEEFDQALAVDPQNQAARFYTDLIAVATGRPGDSTPKWETNLIERTFQLNTNIVFANLERITGALPPVGKGLEPTELINYLHDQVVQAGGNFNPPSAIFYTERLGWLLVRATSADMDRVKKLVIDLSQTPEPAVPPAAITPSHFQAAYRRPGRSEIIHKLDTIRLENISYDNLPLQEVLRDLSVQSKIHDPQKTGIAISIAPAPEGGSDPMDLSDVVPTLIKLNLSHVRLGDLLDAIVLVADHPLKYTINDDGVVFSSKPHENETLFMRTFKVDPHTLLTSMDGMAAAILATNQNDGVAATLKEVVDTLLASEKIDGHNIPLQQFIGLVVTDFSPPKIVFYNDRLGLLFVKATAADLVKIAKAMAFFMPKSSGKKTAAGTPPLFDLSNVAVLTGTPAAAISNRAPNVATITGILTNPNFQVAIHALEQRQGVEYLIEPRVTTTSGREINLINFPRGGFSIPLKTNQSPDSLAPLDDRPFDQEGLRNAHGF